MNLRATGPRLFMAYMPRELNSTVYFLLGFLHYLEV